MKKGFTIGLNRFLKSKPLRCYLQSSLTLTSGKALHWSEFGETDRSKIKYTILYMHGTPMSRLEPMIHSALSTTADTYNHSEVYKQKGIRLCCFERPGFGLTSPSIESRRVVAHVKDIKEAINHPSFQLNYSCANKVYAMGFSAGGPYALACRYLLSDYLTGVAAIASSVSAHMDTEYASSTRGRVEGLFFMLPFSIQTLCYRIAVNITLLGIYTLSAIIQHATLLNSLLDLDPFDNKQYIEEKDAILSKLAAVISLIKESVSQGYESITIDTYIAQSPSISWGFDIPLCPPSSSHTNPASSSLPPLLLYYSKEDTTVPYSAGERLSQRLLGKGAEPVWLSGGHGCFILHLDRILDDLMALPDRKDSNSSKGNSVIE